MAANSFSNLLGQMIFSKAKRPGKYLLDALQYLLDKEFQRIYFEQMMYQGAFLSKCFKNKDSLDLDAIGKECNNMSIQEHKILVDGEYIEQTFKILLSLHKISRGIPIIYDPSRYIASKAVLDPNMFPIHTS
jgi:hypothetical protein